VNGDKTCVDNSLHVLKKIKRSIDNVPILVGGGISALNVKRQCLQVVDNEINKILKSKNMAPTVADLSRPSTTKPSKLNGVVVEGFRIASGLANDPKYPGGTISMQKPFMERNGLKLNDKFMGTLNLDISPFTNDDIEFDIHIENIRWNEHYSESFSFRECSVKYGTGIYFGYVYKPHKNSDKIKCRHEKSIIEVIAPFIDGIGYGDEVEIVLA